MRSQQKETSQQNVLGKDSRAAGHSSTLLGAGSLVRGRDPGRMGEPVLGSENDRSRVRGSTECCNAGEEGIGKGTRPTLTWFMGTRPNLTKSMVPIHQPVPGSTPVMLMMSSLLKLRSPLALAR